MATEVFIAKLDGTVEHRTAASEAAAAVAGGVFGCVFG